MYSLDFTFIVFTFISNQSFTEVITHIKSGSIYLAEGLILHDILAVFTIFIMRRITFDCIDTYIYTYFC